MDWVMLSSVVALDCRARAAKPITGSREEPSETRNLRETTRGGQMDCGPARLIPLDSASRSIADPRTA